MAEEGGRSIEDAMMTREEGERKLSQEISH
jgi:hypothetical protein